MNRILILAIVAIALSSCGASVKVTDSWKTDKINTLKGSKILVIARVDDMITRQRFEQEIAEKLRSEGIDAMESYKRFPDMKQNVKRTKKEVERAVQILKNENFKGIVMTVLKDLSKEIVTSQTGGHDEAGQYGSFYGGFGNYYGGVHSPYGYGGMYVSSKSRTYTSEIYSLETVIYNLDLEPGKQLLGVISINITDPKSVSKVAPKYAKKIAQKLKK